MHIVHIMNLKIKILNFEICYPNLKFFISIKKEIFEFEV
jgi:hypothetical protein